MKLIILFIFCFTLSQLSFSQTPEKRLALVIGNANYDKGELKNPVNDALLISETLKKLEFDVILDTNIANKRSFKETIRKFGSRRADYDVGFVYYAGHGIQVGSENYLLPTKEVFESEYDVQDYGVSVQDIMRYLKAESNQVNILILDACRDNPFEVNWNATRSLKGGGLAKIPPPTGSLIGFSTDAGMTAADGDGKNSVYTKSLSKNLLKEDISIEQVFKNVRSEVLVETNNMQSPVENSKLTGTAFYMKKNFSIYNATIGEILIESDNYIYQKRFYKSIEVLNDAAKIFKQRGDKESEVICRNKIIDNYLNKFRDKETELHLFSIIHHPNANIYNNIENINDFFDSKSYNIFFENLLYFCLTHDEKNQNISHESIYNLLVYIRYVIEIPIQNFGLDLGLSQLNHSVEDYDELLNNLKNKINKNNNYKYLPLTNFWEFKSGYQALRTHNDLKGLYQYNNLEVINSENLHTRFFQDFYTFINECNNSKDTYDVTFGNISFDESFFYEKEIYNYTLNRYNSGISAEIDRMIIDLLVNMRNGKTSQNLELYTDKTNIYFDQIKNGFQLDSEINHNPFPWIVISLATIIDYDLLYNGYNTKESLLLKDLSSKLINYLVEYRDGLISAKKNNDQQTLIKYSNFNKNSKFDVFGYLGEEYYTFTNENGLNPDYLFVIDSVIINDINLQIEYLSLREKALNNNKKDWVREAFNPLDIRHNLEVLEVSEFTNISNKNIKTEILNLEKSSKLSDIIELDVLPILEVLDQTYIEGVSNGELADFDFFQWYPYLNKLSETSTFSNEDHLIILNVINQLRIKFSLSSPNFVWDIKEIVDSYIIIQNLLSESENHLVEFSIKKYINSFVNYYASQIYDDKKLDSEYILFVESEIKRLIENN